MLTMKLKSESVRGSECGSKGDDRICQLSESCAMTMGILRNDVDHEWTFNGISM